MKKIIYIILAIAVIGGGAYAWFYFSKQTGSSAQPSASLPSVQSQSQAQAPAARQTASLSNSITDSFPKTETINIGTGSGSVEVKNFYNIAADTEEGFVIIEDTSDYQIAYDRSTSNFYIYMRSITAQQSKAEDHLLSILGIGQQDICKLNVFVLQLGHQQGTGLSFCANKVK